MQKEDAYGGVDEEGTNATLTNSSTLRPRSSRHLSQHLFNETDFSSNSLHQSMLQLNRRSTSVTASECHFQYEAAHAHAFSASNRRLKEAQFVLEYQQLYNRYSLLITRLQESLREAMSLRQENDNLGIANTDLMKHINVLSQATIQNSLLSRRRSSPLSIVSNFNLLSLGANVADDFFSAEIANNTNTDQVVHPNTTSVRSRDYLNISQLRGSRGKNPIASGVQRDYPGSEHEDIDAGSSMYLTRG